MHRTSPPKKEPGSAIVDSAEEGCGGRIGLNCHCLQPPTTIRRRAGPPAVHCSLSSSPPPCCAKKERVHSNLCPATTSSPPSWLAFAGFCGGGSCGSSLCFAIGASSHHTPFLSGPSSFFPRGEFVVTLQFSLSLPFFFSLLLLCLGDSFSEGRAQVAVTTEDDGGDDAVLVLLHFLLLLLLRSEYGKAGTCGRQANSLRPRFS